MDVGEGTTIILKSEQMDQECKQEPDFLMPNKESGCETVDEHVKRYFKQEHWDKLSELEKAEYKNAYNVYQECLTQGIILPEPNFMISNEEKNVVVKVEDTFLIECKEENSLDVDSNICSGTLSRILDNNITRGTKDRAKRTLPKNLLEIKKSTFHEEGVFALKTIPKGTIFGPYEGLQNIQSVTDYAWKIIDGKLVDFSEIEFSNWIRYIKCAKNIDDRNLFAFQYESDLYYKSIKTISKGKELLVFYEDEFMETLNEDGKKFFKPVVEREMDKFYACSQCCLGFDSEDYLNKHMVTCPYKIGVSTAEIAQCPYCTLYLLSDKEYLENHTTYCRAKFARMRRRSGIDRPKYFCAGLMFAKQRTKTKLRKWTVFF